MAKGVYQRGASGRSKRSHLTLYYSVTEYLHFLRHNPLSGKVVTPKRFTQTFTLFVHFSLDGAQIVLVYSYLYGFAKKVRCTSG